MRYNPSTTLSLAGSYNGLPEFPRFADGLEVEFRFGSRLRAELGSSVLNRHTEPNLHMSVIRTATPWAVNLLRDSIIMTSPRT